MEATWRIVNFDISAVKPSILQLTLHLPQQQTVTFFHGMDSALSALSKNGHTQLTIYFEMNLLNYDAQDTFYHDFPEKFMWNPSKKEWTVRQAPYNPDKPQQIGQIISIHPNNSKLFCFRQLLLH